MTIEKISLFMQQALSEADLAEQNGDVPVGAVIVKSGKTIARGHNKESLQVIQQHMPKLLLFVQLVRSCKDGY